MLFNEAKFTIVISKNLLIIMNRHSIAIGVQKSRYLQLLRYAIIISLINTIINRILYIICEFIPLSTAQGIMQIISGRFVLFSQSIIIIAFVYYGNTIIRFLNNIILNFGA
ncbi:hypothetical protein BDF19DRAFT_232705 [Syncephalis fuscata]|nr:hypothetical protein BDF19DRAFT_232705 [Syncephalis fuscata]